MLVFGRAPDWDVVAISAALIDHALCRLARHVQAHRQVFRGCDLTARLIRSGSPLSLHLGRSLAIQLDDVTKRYRTGRSRTLVDLLASSFDGLRGKSASVHSATRGTVDANIWALKDVTLRGARRRRPRHHRPQRRRQDDAAQADFAGDLADERQGARSPGTSVSLIELGAGFHPELTGRDNVYLGGGLFGLTRQRDRSSSSTPSSSSPTSRG